MSCTLIIEPDHALRDLLQQILAYEGFAVRTAEYGAEALAQVQDHPPGAILLNARLRLMDAGHFLGLYDQLRIPQAPVIVLALTDEAGQSALAAGASEYLVHPFEISDLAAVIGRYTRPVRAPAVPTPECALTLRQWEVAHLVARGCSNQDIARELVITEGTAANHVRQILQRLGFHSRAQIAAWVARQQRDENDLLRHRGSVEA